MQGLKLRVFEISAYSPQEELYDVGKLILVSEKDEMPVANMEFLRRYHRWYIRLARSFASNPVLAFRAMVDRWSACKIACELGVPGVPQDI
jgi:hypothetical protein